MKGERKNEKEGNVDIRNEEGMKMKSECSLIEFENRKVRYIL